MQDWGRAISNIAPIENAASKTVFDFEFELWPAEVDEFEAQIRVRQNKNLSARMSKPRKAAPIDGVARVD